MTDRPAESRAAWRRASSRTASPISTANQVDAHAAPLPRTVRLDIVMMTSLYGIR